MVWFGIIIVIAAMIYMYIKMDEAHKKHLAQEAAKVQEALKNAGTTIKNVETEAKTLVEKTEALAAAVEKHVEQAEAAVVEEVKKVKRTYKSKPKA